MSKKNKHALTPAKPGLVAAYQSGDDPAAVVFVPVAYWRKGEAMVVDGGELVRVDRHMPSSGIKCSSIDMVPEFLMLCETEQERQYAIKQAQGRAKREQDAKMLSDAAKQYQSWYADRDVYMSDSESRRFAAYVGQQFGYGTSQNGFFSRLDVEAVRMWLRLEHKLYPELRTLDDKEGQPGGFEKMVSTPVYVQHVGRAGKAEVTYTNIDWSMGPDRTAICTLRRNDSGGFDVTATDMAYKHKHTNGYPNNVEAETYEASCVDYLDNMASSDVAFIAWQALRPFIRVPPKEWQNNPHEHTTKAVALVDELMHVREMPTRDFIAPATEEAWRLLRAYLLP